MTGNRKNSVSDKSGEMMCCFDSMHLKPGNSTLKAFYGPNFCFSGLRRLRSVYQHRDAAGSEPQARFKAR